MLESQRLQLQMSEARSKIQALESQEGEYQEAEIRQAVSDFSRLELRYQTAIINEASEQEKTPDADVDGETVEMRMLRHDVSIANYISTALNDSPLEGREAELNAALHLEGAGTQLPWAALLTPNDRLEVRAATTAPSDSDVVVASILGRVFSSGAGAHLGVRFPAVPAGSANYPVLSAGVAPSNKAAGGAADQTAATLTANTLDPLRLTAEYLVDLTDLHKLRMMEESLRIDLSGAMMEAADSQIVAGNGTAPNVSGFNHAITQASNPASESEFADYASARPSFVDGRYATSAEEVRILVGADTYAHAASKYQTGSGQSALSVLNGRVSPHVPDSTNSNIQRAYLSRAMGRAVAPMWPSISMIRDNTTVASTGRVKLVAIALWHFKILDTAAYKQLRFKLA